MREDIEKVLADLKIRYSDAKLLQNTKNIQVKMESYGRMVELKETIDQLKEVLANGS